MPTHKNYKRKGVRIVDEIFEIPRIESLYESQKKTDKSVQMLTKLVEDQQQSLHILARAIENLATKLDTVSSVTKPTATLEEHDSVNPNEPNPNPSAKEESSLQFDDLLSSSDVIDDEKAQPKVKIISDAGTRTRDQPVEPKIDFSSGGEKVCPAETGKKVFDKDRFLSPYAPYELKFPVSIGHNNHEPSPPPDVAMARKATTPGLLQYRETPQVHYSTSDVGKPPILETLDAKSYEVFISRYKAYESRGGTRPIHCCISDSVSRLIISYYPDSKEPVIDLIRKEVAPSTLSQFMTRLKSFKLSYDDSMNSLHKYNLLFFQLSDAAPLLAEKYQKSMCRQYIDGIPILKIKSGIQPLLDCDDCSLSMEFHFLGM
ncbi:hypothetical protein ADUPG1_012916 [Aduncisulcus paluster]|uniref:Uncharacterized protein n=1 Tax=Aduncisulcus paluster TaxID=2918883 RepID=A0ABQ5K1S4_9EUKA|nr:hypothetical protein ADUPG1_012916 [Aduncisulcus paluster]